MKRDRPACYKLIVAYDGTRYGGWQLQPSADTIQARLEAPLERICGEPVRTQGAGRTDAGVHARGQVVSFTSNKRVPPAVLLRALNAHLPEDIRVMRAARAKKGFHARFSAKEKEYRYQIVTAPVMDPFVRNVALHHPRPLRAQAMRTLAARLVGKLDFAALSANPRRKVESTVRTVTHLSVRRFAHGMTIVVRADGFLYKMVRGVVGALLKVGRGEATVEEVVAYVQGCRRTHFIETAPACGLSLWKVSY